MPQTLFNQILDETLDLPAAIDPHKKQEIYAYSFELARPDHRHGHRVLVNEGNIADSIYFLLQGTCRFYYYSRVHGQELIPFLMLSPCLLAEGRSFHKILPARFSIAVFEPSTVYKLNKGAIRSITEKYPEVSPSIRLMVKQQNHAFKTWKRELFTKTAGIRYQHLRDTRPLLVSIAKKKDIAGHLGIRDTSLSRLMRTL